MGRLTTEAERQFLDLQAHHMRLGRFEATRCLIEMLDLVLRKVDEPVTR
ncbi:hypothetical protein [Paracraurococcus lichenis]|uniref:Uncharacterized protein n=1 Tax=Paracraurococcus lichenis TaxID=3064888 RepID=A0ABT9DV11_9PROT|nr:hypothetical protein [Paracraurococcus sp. LOR1-02]MDO9707713.1 hypothetical protein [Paracraurococcus sp. LOR1-02]